MKRYLSLTLVFLFVFLLVACQKQNNIVQTDSKPNDTKNELLCVEISQDNWDDYFTVREVLVTPKNDFGDYGTIEDFSVDFSLDLKDEFINSLNKIDVSIDLSWDLSTEQYEFDVLTGKYKVSNNHEPIVTKTYNKICVLKNKNKTCKFTNAKFEFYASTDERTNIPCTFFASNFKCNRAIGTVYFNN